MKSMLRGRNARRAAGLAASSLFLLSSSGYAAAQALVDLDSGEAAAGPAPAAPAAPAPTPPPPAPPAAPPPAPLAPDSEPYPNTDAANGPPNSGDEPVEPDEEDSLYVDKEDDAYVDAVGAWGWTNHSYLVTVSVINMYLHEEDEVFGFHARFLAAGALSLERRRIVPGASPTMKRETTLLIELVDPTLRVHLVDPIFVSVGFNFGMAFYDSMVPTLDGQAGLGFVLGGWGLEGGIRSSRLPRDITKVDGKDFVRTTYSPQVYVDLETNIHW